MCGKPTVRVRGKRNVPRIVPPPTVRVRGKGNAWEYEEFIGDRSSQKYADACVIARQCVALVHPERDALVKNMDVYQKPPRSDGYLSRLSAFDLNQLKEQRS